MVAAHARLVNVVLRSSPSRNWAQGTESAIRDRRGFKGEAANGFKLAAAVRIALEQAVAAIHRTAVRSVTAAPRSDVRRVGGDRVRLRSV
jgi:hypothetical protein